MSYCVSHGSDIEIEMFPTEKKLACHLDGLTIPERDQRRVQALNALNLIAIGSVPIFEEATQSASRFLGFPICILSIADPMQLIFKAAVGLSRLGLMNTLASSRRLPLGDSFCTHVIDSEQVLAIEHAANNESFSYAFLSQRYGIQSYLGVPLFTTDGCCIGTLAVMDLIPRTFTEQDIGFLELTARWSMSEFERIHLHTQKSVGHSAYGNYQTDSTSNTQNTLQLAINAARINLIAQLIQELRNPLTSILGMASMLNREIYGPLTDKQKEYAGIVRSSSQELMSLVDEIIELGAPSEVYQQLNPAPVDIEMLGQQSLQTLEQLAQRREQTLNFTVEPGSRIWMLDKGKVKQLLYNLTFSVVQMAGESSTIRVHVSRRDEHMSIAVWVSNPWLGDGLPQSALTLSKLLPTTQPTSVGSEPAHYNQPSALDGNPSNRETLAETTVPSDMSREFLGLVLSHQLAEIQGGTLTVQGSLEAGQRFVVLLPLLATQESDQKVTL